MDLQHFVESWSKAGAAERSHKDTFLTQLCEVLGVPAPEPKTNDRERDRYVFEHDVPTAHQGGKVRTRKIDLYKRGCFILEATQGSNPGARPKQFYNLRPSCRPLGRAVLDTTFGLSTIGSNCLASFNPCPW